MIIFICHAGQGIQQGAFIYSMQTINAIELGKYNLSTMLALKIARIFDQNLNDIFELEDGD